MFPNYFEYHSPRSLDEVMQLLEEFPYEGKLLAGGHSLLPMMKLRVAAPSVLIDINNIEELKGWQIRDDVLRIGAITRHAELERAADLVEKFPLLSKTARWIADPSVRNRGTIAGSLVHADPASDWGTTMLALRGEVETLSRAGLRHIAMDDFFLDTFTTSLEENEVVTGVRIPLPNGRVGARYMKLERKAGDFAIAGLAVHVELDEGNRVAKAGIGICACGPIPLRSARAESALLSHRLHRDVITEVARLVAEEADPTDDLRGTAAYKRDLLRIFTQRALLEIAAELDSEVKVS